MSNKIFQYFHKLQNSLLKLNTSINCRSINKFLKFVLILTIFERFINDCFDIILSSIIVSLIS